MKDGSDFHKEPISLVTILVPQGCILAAGYKTFIPAGTAVEVKWPKQLLEGFALVIPLLM
jgi:hypothetical protein